MISSDWVGVRDSKYALTGKPAHQQPVIICSREEWEALCHSAADGHSTPATAEIRLILTEEGAGSILSTREGVRLDFTVDEITAFIAGIQAGEFGFQPAPA